MSFFLSWCPPGAQLQNLCPPRPACPRCSFSHRLVRALSPAWPRRSFFLQRLVRVCFCVATNATVMQHLKCDIALRVYHGIHPKSHRFAPTVVFSITYCLRAVPKQLEAIYRDAYLYLQAFPPTLEFKELTPQNNTDTVWGLCWFIYYITGDIVARKQLLESSHSVCT